MVTADEIAAAVACLRRGGVVAFPTETVYGLGADAMDPAAVGEIFRLKGRPLDHPVIVHIADADALRHWAAEVPAAAARLAARFWPGPLTLILPRRATVPAAVTGGQSTVGLRCPAHPVAHALLVACASAGIAGLAAPSANRFGHVSPTTAAHVRAEFGPSLLVLDGGPCAVGIESTIVDLSADTPRVLRPGMIGTAELEAVLGRPLAAAGVDAPRVSGSLASHYAPRTPLRLVSRDDIAQLSQAARRDRVVIGLTPELLSAHDIAMPRAAEAYARALYAALRAADTRGVTEILVECPPADDPWAAIHDRLQRAAHGTPQPAQPP